MDITPTCDEDDDEDCRFFTHVTLSSHGKNDKLHMMLVVSACKYCRVYL